MRHYERTIAVQVPADRVFAYLGRAENLPAYVPEIRKVETLDGERIHVIGDIAGHTFDSKGIFKADVTNQRIEWHTDQRHYFGVLEVKGGDATHGICDVMIHLAFDSPERAGFGEAILEELQKVLEKIRRVTEERLGDGRSKFAP